MMIKQWTIILCGPLSVAMMVAALWAWQSALSLSATATRPEIAVWAVRSGAVALAALAQAALLTCLAGRLYRRDWIADVLRFGAGIVGVLALASAAALGLAGRLQ